ncbi:MAG: hypothetical protein HUN04_26630 [Desulfobacter sp.]|nr:MAG: hypothetical protein HUN04_26630 [Desulfobacter sp.]
MKNPWVAFAGICSLVIGIVIISIIFGGYSSFLRSQNRIEAAKGLVIEQCRLQLDQVKQLAALPGAARPELASLVDASQQAGAVIDHLEKKPIPVDRELLLEFGQVQSRMNQRVDDFFRSVGASGQNARTDQEKKIKAAQAAVFAAGRRYNKEARYFNTRTRVFPGFIVARIFGLDELYFYEISVDLLKPSGEESEVSGAT